MSGTMSARTSRQPIQYSSARPRKSRQNITSRDSQTAFHAEAVELGGHGAVDVGVAGGEDHHESEQ